MTVPNDKLGVYTKLVTDHQLDILDDVDRARRALNSTDLDSAEDLRRAGQSYAPTHWAGAGYDAISKLLQSMLADLFGESIAKAVYNLLIDNGEHVLYQLILLDGFTYDEIARWVHA